MDCGSINSPATFNCLTGTVFPSLITAALTFIGIVTVVLIIVAGIKFITSQGDSKQLDGAKKTLTYAIIGFVIVMGAILTVRILAKVTGVNCIINVRSGFGFTTCR